jgi:signal transduction histidine kinase
MPKGLILNVDDDAGGRYARNRILQSAGFEVVEAATGRDALEKLALCPQLVILDVGLPDIDGFTVCRTIKANPETARIAVLQVSASFVRAEDRRRALEGGADSFVTEPVEPEVLIATVNALLRMRRAEEEVERAAQEWAASFDAINEGVALLGDEGVVQRCNRAFGALLGQPVGEIVGERWDTLVAPFTAEQGRDGALEPRTLFRVGVRFVQAGVTPMTAVPGRAARSVVVLTDVTDHRTALAAAEDANRLKDEFLAVLSHELRTPLNAIVGWVHLLQMGTLGAAETAKALQTIGRNAHVQSQIISDILDVSSIIAGKLRLQVEHANFIAVVEAALETVKPLALAKGVRLETELSADARNVDGDPGRLQQVVWNLLSNAIKYAPPSGLVRARLARADERLELTIEDDGPGVKPEFLPYVFDRFRQADSSSSRPKGGLGLGLAIVKHIVELHGGTVSARNRAPGPGAAFTISLPQENKSRAQSAMARAVSVAAIARGHEMPLDGVRALVVDDEEDARTLVAAVLESYGADVQTAASGMEALPIVERERPDVLISDIEMPGEDGYELMRKLRRLPPGKGGQTPAVALTAYARPEDKDAAIRAGFQVHLAKPVSPLELLRIVTTITQPV